MMVSSYHYHMIALHSSVLIEDKSNMESNITCSEYATVSLVCPIGTLQVTGCVQGIHSVQRTQTRKNEVIDSTVKCELFGTNKDQLPIPVSMCVQWLKEYFSHPNSTSLVVSGQYPPICPLLELTPFARKVYTNVAFNVRFGSKITYSDLAKLIENPNASRAVGTALKNNPFTIVIPCHRVVPKTGGGVGFYGGGAECTPLKEWLLQYEQNVVKSHYY